MSAQRYFVAAIDASQRASEIPITGDRRSGDERRALDRRSNVIPFESRETRLRFAAQAAGFGTFDLDCVSGECVWSPELLAMAGQAPERPVLSMAEAESLIYPDDRQAFRNKLRASLDPRGNGEFEDEHRLVRPDGATRWVKTKGRAIFTGQAENRRAWAVTGVVMDVTETHLAQQELAQSREELSKLLDSAIDAIITVDADQRIQRFNPAAARMFGISVEQALGSPLDRFIPHRHRAAHREHVRHFSEGGVTSRHMGQPGIFSGLRANGEEFPIEATIAKVEISGHRRLTVFMCDITERVKAEEALRRSKEDLELAVRGGRIGTWHWSASSGSVEWSQRTSELLGIPAGDPMTLGSLFAAIHPADRETVKAALRRTLKKGADYNVEYRAIWPDGNIRWIQSIGREVRDLTTHRIAGIRGIALDITERKLLQEALEGKNLQLESRIDDRTQELIKSNEALERSNLELQQFAFIAAHDLQTPLRTIAGFAQLLNGEYRGRLDARADAWLEQIVLSSRHMHNLIRDLLSYSRVESRGNPFQVVDLNRLLDDVLATLDGTIRESQAIVTSDSLPTVQGDRTQLAQVLQNLIDNAIKYHELKPPRVHVSSERRGDEWVFSVCDEGIGIAEKHLEQIFDIFRRLHTQQEYPGTGIGLAVCRRVILRHGGRIWAESAKGQGSTFHFTLPAQVEGT